VASTEAFLGAGDTVVGTSKSIQASSFLNPRFVAITSDLTDVVSTCQLVEAVMQRFQRIDALAHLMGVSGGKANRRDR
jgi:NAD(P)-dependent dehydrogenase (short-subunit alcohol dehydrogenase family)